MIATRVVLVLALALAVSAKWMTEEAKRVSESKTPVQAKEFTVDLDLPQEERWQKIGEKFASRSFALVNYLRENLPDGWLEPLEKVAAELMPFFKDYGDEMKGYAKALNVTQGDIVMINLVYQLEHLGVSCTNWNTTGPVEHPKFCVDDNGKNVGYGNLQISDEPEENEGEDGPGMCTSFVASTTTDPTTSTIYHGRNLDWNLEDSLKEFIINVEYTRDGKEVFHGTTIVGFVGILQAVKPNGFGWSMDARRKGGSVAFNLLQSLFAKGVRTPEQHARYVFETETKYDAAVEALGSHPIVNQAYFIVSGTKYPEGVVLARNRNGVAHAYQMDDEIPMGKNGPVKMPFWTGITNYDLNVPAPPADDRTTPLTERLNALKGTAFDASDIWTIIRTFPTLNPHTDISGVFEPKTGAYDVEVLYDHSPPSNQ